MKPPLRTGFLRVRKAPAGVAACVAAIAAFVVLLTSATALALPADRAYEMVSPVDKRGQDVGAGGFGGNYRAAPDGNTILYQALGGWGDAPANALTGLYYAKRGEESWSSTSALLPVYPKNLGSTAVYAVSPDFSRIIAISDLDFETGEASANYLSDAYLVDPVTKQMERLTPDAVDGVPRQAASAGGYDGSFDFSTVIFESSMALTDDVLTGLTGNVSRIYRYSNGELTLVSRTPDGDAVNGSFPLFSTSASAASHQPTNRVSANADVFYFRSQYPSVTQQSLYRRDMSVSPAVTDLVNAEENSLETVPVGAADLAGASAGGDVAYFASAQRLVDEDTDSTADIYRYDHSQPEDSRLTLISVDAEPGDAASATHSSYGVSDDGKTVVFTSNSQLVGGETTATGPKLFAWHDGELRFIAMTGAVLTTNNTTWSQNDEYFGFLANGADVTTEDNGGTLQAYRYEVSTGELKCVSCVGGGSANTLPASWRRDPSSAQLNPARFPIRNIANDGTVFFQTAESLVGSDTNGKIDVYMWSEEEGPELISTGRSIDDSWMMDASADGSTVFFLTRSRLSAWDKDDLLDAYAAKVGGGLPEPPETAAPCAGEDCLGKPSQAPTFTNPSSTDNHSAGNPKAESTDCTRLDRRAKQLQRKAKRKAKQLRSAKGKKAKRQAMHKAKRSKRQAKRSAKRAQRCKQGAGR